VYEVLAGAYPTRSHDGSEVSNMPWAGMGFIDILSAVAKGLRPVLAAAAVTDANVLNAAAYASSMQQCLHADPSLRPSFAELVAGTSSITV
jgi:hypothetical protein